ncbi:hypothetical protein ACQP1U_00730 [Actinomycetota bacterium]
MVAAAIHFPDSLNDAAPAGFALFLTWYLVMRVMEERSEAAHEWVRTQMRITDMRYDGSDISSGSTPGTSSYVPVGQVRTRDGRWVDAEAMRVVSDATARGWLGTTRDAWYREANPSEVRLVPPAGQGLLLREGWKVALALLVIVVGFWMTFVKQ